MDAAKVHKVVDGLDGLASDGDALCNCCVTEELWLGFLPGDVESRV